MMMEFYEMMYLTVLIHFESNHMLFTGSKINDGDVGRIWGGV